MIEYHLNSAPHRRRWWRRRQRVLAIFSYRYDHHLVPDLLANLEPIVDGWVAYDDRASSEVFSDEQARRRALVDTARGLGADWLLAVDPDERFEAQLADHLPQLIARRRRTAWSFELREMYTPGAYRVDGIWGRKQRFRLFSVYEPTDDVAPRLHGQWFPETAGYALRHCKLNIYHLRMISPRRRRLRRDLYNALDPDRRYQSIGYDYLADDRGLRLESIGLGRHYQPIHHDDGGLWSASPAIVSSTNDHAPEPEAPAPTSVRRASARARCPIAPAFRPRCGRRDKAGPSSRLLSLVLAPHRN